MRYIIQVYNPVVSNPVLYRTLDFFVWIQYTTQSGNVWAVTYVCVYQIPVLCLATRLQYPHPQGYTHQYHPSSVF